MYTDQWSQYWDRLISSTKKIQSKYFGYELPNVVHYVHTILSHWVYNGSFSWVLLILVANLISMVSVWVVEQFDRVYYPWLRTKTFRVISQSISGSFIMTCVCRSFTWVGIRGRCLTVILTFITSSLRSFRDWPLTRLTTTSYSWAYFISSGSMSHSSRRIY